jgi:FkbM family methyltransferase
MMKSIAQNLRTLKNTGKVSDLYWAGKFVEYNIAPGHVKVEEQGKSIFIDDFNISLQKDKHEFFLRGFSLLYPLRDLAKAKFQVTPSHEIIAEIHGMKFYVETWEEIFILSEIFVNGLYNIKPVQTSILIDIGMNTGFASLMFANQENIQSVISFEPFKQTRSQAMRNLEMNQNLASKIQVNSFGLSLKSQDLTLDYCYEWKGCAGLSGLPTDHLQENEVVSQEVIQVVESSTVIQKIADENPGVPLIAKIDCEGSEYDILQSLYEAGKLDLLDSVMMEWHNPLKLELLHKWFNESGFSIMSMNHTSDTTGMMYAFRRPAAKN